MVFSKNKSLEIPKYNKNDVQLADGSIYFSLFYSVSIDKLLRYHRTPAKWCLMLREQKNMFALFCQLEFIKPFLNKTLFLSLFLGLYL